MDQDIFHNIDTDRYAEKLKTMYVVTFRHIHSKGGIFSDVNMGLIISPNNLIIFFQTTRFSGRLSKRRSI